MLGFLGSMCEKIVTRLSKKSFMTKPKGAKIALEKQLARKMNLVSPQR